MKANKLEKIDGELEKINEAVTENMDANKDMGEKIENLDNRMQIVL